MMIEISIFTQHGVGKINEDFVSQTELCSGVHAIAVADGMGGLSCGEVAARLTSESIVTYLKEGSPDCPIEQLLVDSMKYANDVIRRECEYRKVRMGASIAVAVISRDECHYLSLGNVRIYISHRGLLRQITEDHINEIAGQTYLTRCVKGRPFRYRVVVGSVKLSPGDELIIASDGYYIYNDVTSADTQRTVNDDDATCVRIGVR